MRATSNDNFTARRVKVEARNDRGKTQRANGTGEEKRGEERRREERKGEQRTRRKSNLQGLDDLSSVAIYDFSSHRGTTRGISSLAASLGSLSLFLFLSFSSTSR